MLLPLSDPHKLHELLSLLDQNALDLICEDFDQVEQPARLLDLVELPQTPRMGPDNIAELHMYAADRHSDQEWTDAHLAARLHYLEWARDLFDHGQDILTRPGAFDHPELESHRTSTTLSPRQPARAGAAAAELARILPARSTES